MRSEAHKLTDEFGVKTTVFLIQLPDYTDKICDKPGINLWIRKISIKWGIERSLKDG